MPYAVACLMCSDLVDVAEVLGCQTCELAIGLCSVCLELVDTEPQLNREFLQRKHDFIMKHGSHEVVASA